MTVSSQRNCNKSPQMYTNMGKKFAISSALGFVITSLRFPPDICVKKQDGSCKTLSLYFSKMVVITRYQGYQPIPRIF